ncbi:MAG: hypothetical protein BGO01_16715 [Armatimonadetes bacterium 55-13]|nr:MAG: hypothetical protein BGO01_16715 [Armatimonadetes bacterium 55-13]
MRYLPTILAVLSLGLTLGCGPSKTVEPAPPKPAGPFASVVGDWTGKKDNKSYQITIDEVGKFIATGTVSFTDAGQTRTESHTAKGKVILEGDKLKLVAEEFDGEAPDSAVEKQPESLTLSADGQSLSVKNGIVLSRS